MAKVKAIQEGYDGIQIRKKGDIFDFEGPLGTWMEAVDKKEESKSDEDAESKPSGKGKK
jgi:hypothetical protein